MNNITKGIKNIIKWLPIIWRDRDWDYCFIYIILQFKLKSMEKYFNKSKYSDTISQAKRIKTCTLLLDRLMADNYYDIAFKVHDKKWGKSKINWEELKNTPEYSKLKITRSRVKTDKDKEMERREYLLTKNHEIYLYKQDLSYLFLLMKKHIQTWWD